MPHFLPLKTSLIRAFGLDCSKISHYLGWFTPVFLLGQWGNVLDVRLNDPPWENWNWIIRMAFKIELRLYSGTSGGCLATVDVLVSTTAFKGIIKWVSVWKYVCMWCVGVSENVQLCHFSSNSLMQYNLGQTKKPSSSSAQKFETWNGEWPLKF